MDTKPVQTITLPAAILSIYGPSEEAPLGHIHTRLVDGSENVCAPLAGDEYGRVREEMGFPATQDGRMRYAVMHECGHHLVACQMYHPLFAQLFLSRPELDAYYARTQSIRNFGCVSRIIYNACHNIPQSMGEPESKAEEHLVNSLQKFTMTGAADPYGELERVFGERLSELVRELVRVSMPWLEVRA